MQRRIVVAVMLGLIATGALPGVATATSPSVEATIDEAYEEWHDALGIRQECATGATVILEAVDGRQGEYRVAAQQVVIDPSISIAAIPDVVIHELSHHVFIRCGAFADSDLSESFYEAQGLPASRDWFDYSSGWGNTPVEQFAAAMTMSITGAETPGIGVTADAAAVVTRWLAGAPISVRDAREQPPVPYAPEPAAIATQPADVAPARTQASQPVSTDERSTPAADVNTRQILEIVRRGLRLARLVWRAA